MNLRYRQVLRLLLIVVGHCILRKIKRCSQQSHVCIIDNKLAYTFCNGTTTYCSGLVQCRVGLDACQDRTLLRGPQKLRGEGN